MKILAIGNSFSEDATRYLHAVAAAGGVSLKVNNLVIGGCSLKSHYDNLESGEKLYASFENGENTGALASLSDALGADDWDYITLQQASPYSFNFATYEPYLTELSKRIREKAPRAAQLIHQTWSYKEGGDMLFFTAGYKKRSEMFADVKAAYERAGKSIGAAGIIPAGEAMQLLAENGAENIYRDDFHASLGLGRYTLALTWFEYIAGGSALLNSFSAFDEPVSPREAEIAKKSAAAAVAKYPPLKR